MKARILDPDVKVYSSTDANSVSIATLHAGSEIEFGGAKRKAGKVWVPITLSTGQQAFIPGETRIYVIKQGALMQNNVELRSEPSSESLVKQQLPRNTRIYILQVVKGGEKEWVKVRDMSGSEGYIAGDTRLRMIQQQTKALGMKNIRSGVMWLIAGLILLFSTGSPVSGGSFLWFGYGAALFGGLMLVMGVVQYLRAPS
jgi:uncharacterized protein YgiM (DUF1202 family)